MFSSFNKGKPNPWLLGELCQCGRMCACHLGQVPTGAYFTKDPWLEEERYTPELWEGWNQGCQFQNNLHVCQSCPENCLPQVSAFLKHLLALTMTALCHSFLHGTSRMILVGLLREKLGLSLPVVLAPLAPLPTRAPSSVSCTYEARNKSSFIG